MSIGITDTDKARYHKKPAWHNLGEVTTDAESPTEAMNIVAPWTVEQTDGVSSIVEINGEPTRVHSKESVMNVRSDNGAVLGVVGKNYTPVQNKRLALFAESLAGLDRALTTEACFTLYGGRRVCLVTNTSPFELKGDDPIYPFLVIANGHDGSMPFTAKFNPFRPECANMLAMALKTKTNREFKIRHKAAIEDRMKIAAEALGIYSQQIESYQETAEAMNNIKMTKHEMNQFFLNTYQNVFKVDMKKLGNDKAATRRQNHYNKFTNEMRTVVEEELGQNSQRERSLWYGFNAFSNVVQHKDARSKSTAAVGERDQSELNTDSIMFGSQSDTTERAWNEAVKVLANA